MMKILGKNSTPQILTGIIICLFFFSSCESEKREKPTLPDVVSFQDHIIIEVFDPSCNSSGCHGGRTAPDLTSANAYSDLNSGNYLNLDDPANSKLYVKISDGGSMERYADDYDRALILKWIEQGAFDN